jgi:hypothetical protein
LASRKCSINKEDLARKVAKLTTGFTGGDMFFSNFFPIFVSIFSQRNDGQFPSRLAIESLPYRSFSSLL